MFKRIILIAALLLMSSCGDDTTKLASPTDAKPQAPPKVQMPKAPANVPQPQYHANNPAPAVSAPPAGAQYTIFCARVEGDLHVERAGRMKNELISATSMKDWYVIHQNDQSLLYYGYYRAINDPKDAKETARAKADRQKIDGMTDPMGNRPFKQALFVELSAPDPVAPPEWNLLNAPGDCSLQIAVYKDSPLRKEKAIESVRDARAQGVEAYYYHGESSSLVCIGHWPRSAYRIVNAAPEQAPVNDPAEQTVMVVPMTGDPTANLQFDAMAEQNNAKLVRPKVEIVDATLKATMLKYSKLTVNGMETRRIVNGKEQFDPSLLVPIPRQAAPAAVNAREPAVAQPDPAYQPPPVRSTAPPSKSSNGAGKLRSIGD